MMLDVSFFIYLPRVMLRAAPACIFHAFCLLVAYAHNWRRAKTMAAGDGIVAAKAAAI